MWQRPSPLLAVCCIDHRALGRKTPRPAVQGDTSLDPRPSEAPRHRLTRPEAISSSCSQRIDHYEVKELRGGRLLEHILAGVGLGAVISVLSWHQCLASHGISGQGGQDCGLLGAPSPNRGSGDSPELEAVSFPYMLITSLHQGWSWH